MTPSEDQLAVLQRLYDEGQISDEEFQGLAGEPAETVGHRESKDSENTATDDATATAEAADEPAPFLLPRFRKDISSTHGLGLVVAGAVIVGMALAGLMSSWIALAAILVSLTTLVEGWKRVTSIGALVVAALFLAGVVSTLTGSERVTTVAAANTPTPTTPAEGVPGSLGVYMDELPELWNTVDASPTINRGLVRQNEIGEYDTFVHRFGDGAQVAGAYGPDNDAVYALLVSGPFSYPPTSQLYLHVCYVVAPFSQECIDSYLEQGLDGGTLEDFVDTVHEAEWMLGDHTWRLEIGQNLLAIRVYGADAA